MVLMRALIAAVSVDGAIGVDGGIPWHYPGDLRRFKRLTLDGTIVMGRLTWLSLGCRALPRRRNIVLTGSSAVLPNAEVAHSVDEVLERVPGDLWFIGGAQLYVDAMPHCTLFDITRVPDRVGRRDAVMFPAIDRELFESEGSFVHPDDPRLTVERFVRRAALPVNAKRPSLAER